MNNEQMQLIEDKYGKLIHKIGHYISGDNAISSHEDNTQDIWMAAIEAIRGYAKKENMSFDEFWGTKGFDKYLKTCLWNIKNSKGAKITKKFNITRNTVDIVDNEEVLSLEDTSSIPDEVSSFLSELSFKMNSEQEQVVKLILEDPNMIKPNGKVSVSSLVSVLGKTRYEIGNILNTLQEKLNNVL
jgi:DNA-directed RNA polymerase specialized sigma24 family protein